MQINYDYATLNCFLLVIQNLQIEGQKLIKQKLEFENWILIQSFYRCLNIDLFTRVSECLCGFKLWYFKCWLLLVECIWLKYQWDMPSEIKTLKHNHRICIQPGLWNVAMQCQITDTFFRPRPIHFKSATRMFLF